MTVGKHFLFAFNLLHLFDLIKCDAIGNCNNNANYFNSTTYLGECIFNFSSDTVPSGNFSSPNWPSHYPHEMRCVYNFNGKPYQAINLTFLAFELNSASSKGCLNDYVDISTTTTYKIKRLLGRYCGNQVPSPLLSVHPQLEIIFTANQGISKRGFYGHFEFLDESKVGPPDSSPKNIVGCGGNETGIGGVLVSPNYPGPFPKQIDCIWLIRVRQDQHIYIRIVELQLVGSIAYCQDAHLAIYDGYESLEFDPKKPKKYCGDLTYYKNVEDKFLLSTSNRLLIRFKSDVTTPQWSDQVASGSITGFKLVWTAVSLKLEGQCNEFLCRNSKFCVNPVGGKACKDNHNFCIDNKHHCNGLPNCSEMDTSDEDNCNISLFIGTAVGLGFTFFVLLICFCCCRRQKLPKNSAELNHEDMLSSMQLKHLDRSPSFTSRPVGHFASNSLNVGRDINCSVHGCRSSRFLPAPVQTHFPYQVEDLLNNRFGYTPTDV